MLNILKEGGNDVHFKKRDQIKNVTSERILVKLDQKASQVLKMTEVGFNRPVCHRIPHCDYSLLPLL